MGITEKKMETTTMGLYDIWGLGFGVGGLGFKVQGLGLQLYGVGFNIHTIKV